MRAARRTGFGARMQRALWVVSTKEADEHGAEELVGHPAAGEKGADRVIRTTPDARLLVSSRRPPAAPAACRR